MQIKYLYQLRVFVVTPSNIVSNFKIFMSWIANISRTCIIANSKTNALYRISAIKRAMIGNSKHPQKYTICTILLLIFIPQLDPILTNQVLNLQNQTFFSHKNTTTTIPKDGGCLKSSMEFVHFGMESRYHFK